MQESADAGRRDAMPSGSRSSRIDPAEVHAAAPARTTLPSIDELDELCRELRGAGVPVEQIGTSRGGRPIYLVSPPSKGRKTALVVGTPHPNEPIGGLTIVTLLSMLRSRHPLLAESPFQWHFIPSIEPDGLAWNGSWLDTPHDFGAYSRGFYRPAFQHQAEYTFPLSASRYRFDQSTPETKAWMSAIDRLRPALMVSLHNADHGGAFHVLSRPHPQLAADLTQASTAHGVPLDAEGDPYGEMQKLSAGVFLVDDMRAMVEHAPGSWNAGDCSFGFATKHGTLGLIPEVPLWREAEAAGERPMSDATSGLATLYDTTIALVARAKERAHDHALGDPLLCAILEGSAVLRRLLALNTEAPAASKPAMFVNRARRRLRMLPFRTLGMLHRWCHAEAVAEGGAERRRALEQLQRDCADWMNRQLADASLTEGMLPVPIRDSVATQIHAVLCAADAASS